MAKIVLITSNIAPYRLKWAEQLVSHFEVEIVYTKDHDYERDDRWLQKESRFCKITKLKNDKDKYNPLCFDVIDVIKENKDNLIIFDGYGPLTNLLGLNYCFRHHIDCFINVDGYALGEKRSRIKEIIKKYVISHYGPYFLCSSFDTKKHLIEFGGNENNIYVHNFSSITSDRIIDKPVSEKEKMNIRKRLGIDTDKQIVLSVGAFIPRKRYEDLIKAVIDCQSDCHLYLVGGKPNDTYLELSKNHDNIHFVDFVLPEQVDDYYKACDLFVLSSQTDVWGLVINEAMANGLPVVSSDNCVACYSLVKDNGIIYKTGDIDELSKAIDKCLDKENNKKMSKESLEIIKDFTIEKMVEKQLVPINEYFDRKK